MCNKNSKEKIAELIGILLGDGYMDPKSKRIKISFNSKDDKEYIVYVKDLVESFDVKTVLKQRKNENTAELYIFNTTFTNFLINNIGLKYSPKWNRAIIPTKYSSGRLSLLVLRGYLDTDECVALTNNNGTLYPRLEMKVSPAPMQNQIIKILGKYKFRFGVYQIGKGKVRIQMNGKDQLRKWSDLIGFGNEKHQKKAMTFL